MLSSLDILYLVITFAVLWIAGFVCWFIWHIIMMLRELHKATQTLTRAVEDVEKSIHGIKAKFGSGRLSDHFKNTVETLRDKASEAMRNSGKR